MFNKEELNKLYRYALSLTVQEDVAYDLVQTGLERYLNKTSQPVEKPLAYLKIIIRNLYFDFQRRNKVVPMVSIESSELPQISPIDDTSMEDLLVNEQEVQCLLASLNSEENELLYLWAVEEYTAEEISLLYKKPRGTILSKLHRLKNRIREQIQAVAMLDEVISDE